MKYLVSILLLCFALSSQAKDNQNCPVSTWSNEQKQDFVNNEFSHRETELEPLAIAMRHCLSMSDPEIRDGIAFSAYSFWLRNDLLSNPAKQKLFNLLSSDISAGANDQKGVYLPFAVLVFSEVIRADRVNAFLSDEDFDNAITLAERELSQITDYRGFEDGLGWRHQVAHTSDLALQLILNKRTDQSQLKRLVNALLKQVAPKEHSYTFGESKRLMMPILYAWLANGFNLKEWQQYLNHLVDPKPFESWRDVYKSEQGLHKRHNTKLFLLELYSIVSRSNSEKLQKLAPSIVQALDQIG